MNTEFTFVLSNDTAASKWHRSELSDKWHVKSKVASTQLEEGMFCRFIFDNASSKVRYRIYNPYCSIIRGENASVKYETRMVVFLLFAFRSLAQAYSRGLRSFCHPSRKLSSKSFVFGQRSVFRAYRENSGVFQRSFVEFLFWIPQFCWTGGFLNAFLCCSFIWNNTLIFGKTAYAYINWL